MDISAILTPPPPLFFIKKILAVELVLFFLAEHNIAYMVHYFARKLVKWIMDTIHKRNQVWRIEIRRLCHTDSFSILMTNMESHKEAPLQRFPVKE